ncbi:hypothetical protein GE09DRAFT_1124150, partial [Coniochaeta sp. 2T2.1]
MSGPCIYVGVTLPCLLHLYLSLVLCYGSLIPKAPLPKNYVEAKTCLLSFSLDIRLLTSPLSTLFILPPSLFPNFLMSLGYSMLLLWVSEQETHV